MATLMGGYERYKSKGLKGFKRIGRGDDIHVR
jgi:hypothetical protein